MLSNMIMILAIIYVSLALFYLFYTWLEFRKERRQYKEFKQKMDEELETILKELCEDLKIQEDDEE